MMRDMEKAIRFEDLGRLDCVLLGKCIRWASDPADKAILLAEQKRRADLDA